MLLGNKRGIETKRGDAMQPEVSKSSASNPVDFVHFVVIYVVFLV